MQQAGHKLASSTFIEEQARAVKVGLILYPGLQLVPTTVTARSTSKVTTTKFFGAIGPKQEGSTQLCNWAGYWGTTSQQLEPGPD